MNYLGNNDVNNIFVMVCDATTPRQKLTILQKTAVDIELFKDLLKWFVLSSACQDFKNSPIPDDVEMLQPTIIEGRKDNTTAKEVDPSIENKFGDTQFFFSLAQDPTEEASVYKTSKKFACAVINRSAPTRA